MKINFLCVFFALLAFLSSGHTSLSLDSILTRIETTHPQMQGADARIRELDTYAKGAITMPAPRVVGGFFMTPYNTARWSEGMGSFMVTSEQMFPNRSMQKAEQRYMGVMSGMEVAERGVMRNMLFVVAKTAYYTWLVLEKKIAVLEGSKNALRLLIESAEQRFQYNREKLGSVYKAQTELANLERMQAMYAGEIRQQCAMLNATPRPVCRFRVAKGRLRQPNLRQPRRPPRDDADAARTNRPLRAQHHPQPAQTLPKYPAGLGTKHRRTFMTLDAWLELKMSRLSQLDLLQQLLLVRTDYEKELEQR